MAPEESLGISWQDARFVATRRQPYGFLLLIVTHCQSDVEIEQRVLLSRLFLPSWRQNTLRRSTSR